MVKVVIAAPMKTGSTYVSSILAHYFDVADYKPFLGWGWQDHVLLPETLRAAPDRFVMQTHLKPSRPNLACILRFDLRVLGMWRNLGDVVVSLADHIARETSEMPVCYVPHRGEFLAQNIQQQYAFLIRTALPWYLGFWRMWHSKSPAFAVTLIRYEDLIEDRHLIFRRAINHIDPLREIDQDRLTKCLEVVARRDTRRNIAVNGRSQGKLSGNNQRLIEEVIKQYISDVRVAAGLIAELPWIRNS